MTGESVSVEETDLGAQLADLWSDERCAWHIDFDERAGSTLPWILSLEWTQEYGNPHGADWATYTWQVYGETVDEALAGAVEWCAQLRALEPLEDDG